MRLLTLLIAAILHCQVAAAQTPQNPQSPFQAEDVFELRWVSDAQISPDGKKIAYVRNAMDAKTDRRVTSLWLINSDGTEDRPLVPGTFSSPRWSGDGTRIMYSGSVDGVTQIFVYYVKSGHSVQITKGAESVGAATWSPDGKFIAYTSRVLNPPIQLFALPPKPADATWADPVRISDALATSADGQGRFLAPGSTHVYVVAADGGPASQLTSGQDLNYRSPEWTADSTAVMVSASPKTMLAFPEPVTVYTYPIDGSPRRKLFAEGKSLGTPVASPDGKWIAYTANRDASRTTSRSGRVPTMLMLARAEGSQSKRLTRAVEWEVASFRWRPDSNGLFINYGENGRTKAGRLGLDGRFKGELVDDIGPSAIGEPTGGGGSQFSVGSGDILAYASSTPYEPGALTTFRNGTKKNLVSLNDALFSKRELGKMEEFWYQSGDVKVQAFMIKPPGFDPTKRYPLLLTIHGGPAGWYSPTFSAAHQLYASAGYVVLATNPRGSTSFGQDFADAIYHDFPSVDYDDLMAGVDATIAKGFIDERNLFVTGGSGGGILTAWIVSKTDRFRAASVMKPVINYVSWGLTVDLGGFAAFFGEGVYPWTDLETLIAHSPLYHVDKVTTPTMLIVGDADQRTPLSEALQFYTALKYRGVDTVIMQLPDAAHNTMGRPSQLIAVALGNAGWFDRYKVRN